MPYQLPGIDIGDRNDILFLEIVLYRFLCLFAGIVDIVILTNQPGYLDVIRFHFLLRDTVIADVRVGGHHDLPEIRGVGKYLLVAGHAGIKADLARRGAYLARRFAIKYSTVSQQQNSR